MTDTFKPVEPIEGHGLAFDWAELQTESRDIFFSRHQKYGPRNIADAPGGALNGVVVRMHDKMARLRNFIEGDKTEYSDESIHDTLIDISNYANIARLILKEQWPNA